MKIPNGNYNEVSIYLIFRRLATRCPNEQFAADSTHNNTDMDIAPSKMETPQSTPALPASRVPIILMLAIIAALLVSNVLTLTSASAHRAGYAVIEGLLRQVASQPVAEAWLKYSTIAQQKNEVARATRVLAAAHADLQTKTERLSRATIALSDSTRALANQHRTLGRSVADLREAAARQRKAVMRVSRILATRAARSATRSVTTLSGKLAPAVGAALSVAGTALDISDLCDSIRDMNTLNAEFGLVPEDTGAVCGVRVPTLHDATVAVKGAGHSVYQSAVSALRADGAIVDTTVPNAYWQRMRQAVCPTVASMPPAAP